MILKSLFDSIGTAAGVAWPLFGIIASTLSFIIGGVIALHVGLICCLLFLSVSIPVFYISYNTNKALNEKLQRKFSLNLINFLDAFHQHYLQQNSQKSFLDCLMDWASQQGEDKTIQIKFIHFIQANGLLNNFDGLTLNQQKACLNTIVTTYFNSRSFVNNVPIPPTSDLAKTFFLGFVGAFGSIAGCSAGMMGLLVTIGLTTGFAAIPILGAAVLCISIGSGLISGFFAVQKEIENKAISQVYKNFKRFNNVFRAENYAILPNQTASNDSSDEFHFNRSSASSNTVRFFQEKGEDEELPHSKHPSATLLA